MILLIASVIFTTIIVIVTIRKSCVSWIVLKIKAHEAMIPYLSPLDFVEIGVLGRPCVPGADPAYNSSHCITLG